MKEKSNKMYYKCPFGQILSILLMRNLASLLKFGFPFSACTIDAMDIVVKLTTLFMPTLKKDQSFYYFLRKSFATPTLCCQKVNIKW